MDRDSVKEFIRDVVGPNTTMVDSQNWVSIPCPLAQWTHAGGKDTHPSAGISVNEEGVSVFNCFTCHERGKLSWLLKKLERYTGEDWHEQIVALDTDEKLGGHIPEWGAVKHDTQTTFTLLDKEQHFDLYESAIDHPYLLSRGVDRVTVEVCELLFDPDSDFGRILFPVYTPSGGLLGFSGRDVSGKAKLRVKDYFGLPKRLALLGSHLVSKHDEYVILVEGLFDYANLAGMGYPAMAMMSSNLTEYQADILKDFGKPVYIFHDNDQPGIDARDKAAEMLCQHIPVMKVRYPSVQDSRTGRVRQHPPSDPAELSESEVERMLMEARLL